MCLIVAKPNADASFSIPDCRASLTRNSDGIGIMYYEEGRIKVHKMLGNLRECLEMYAEHMTRDSFILHHRFATVGDKSLENVHPFKILSIDDGDPYDLFMCHNGSISMSKFDTDHDKRLSDTHLFCVEYLRPLMKKYPDIIDDAIFQTMLHDFIGFSNKLAFLSSRVQPDTLEDGTANPNAGKARTYIFNKQQGDEKNGCWLSNKYSIETYQTKTYHAQTHGVHHNLGGWNEDLYDYEDGVYSRKEWRAANEHKEKLDGVETLSGMDIGEIITNIDTYAGMGTIQLRTLFIDEPYLVYDMVYLLDSNTVDKSLLDESAVDVADKLFTLLQEYQKKAAA